MPSSLLAGVSGLQADQEMLDVVGNNLANINTTGFESQQVNFEDLIYQGQNPLQVGTGVNTADIDTNLQQGSLQTTGNNLDLAIQGSGYFVVNNGQQDLYSRAGSFAVDKNDFLVDPATGARVQRFGTLGEGSPTSPAFQTPGDNDIKILPDGTSIPGQVTSTVTVQGNLSASATGPQAAVLTSGTPYTASGAAATSTTLLNSLDGNLNPYKTGDSITIAGQDASGAAVNTTVSVDATSTMGTLISAINNAYTGATASLDANGNLVLTAKNPGPTNLSLTLSDTSGNNGGTPFSNHALATTTVGQNGNTVPTAIQVFDSQGTAHTLNLVFQKQGNGLWNLTASINPQDGTMVTSQVTGIRFNDDGSLAQAGGAGAGTPKISFLINGMATPQTVNLSLGSTNGFSGLTQFGGASTAAATGQDGFAPGTLSTLSVSSDGVITGTFSNGQTQSLAQIAMATFTNPEGLDRTGSNYYSVTNNSGTALVGTPSSGGRGSLQSGALENSNVDVSLEFTRLIVAQRSYEANAQTIKTSSEVLQTLTNILQ